MLGERRVGLPPLAVSQQPETGSRPRFTSRQHARLTLRSGQAAVGDGGGAGASSGGAPLAWQRAGSPRLQRQGSSPSPPGPSPTVCWELEEGGDLVVGRAWPLVRQSLKAVHTVERLEHRLQKRAARLPVGLRRLLAGGVAGAAGKTATAPLETVKMQLIQSGGTTVLAAASETWRRGGPAAFFRGNSVDVLRTIPSRGLELSSYAWIKRVFRRWNRKHDGGLHIPDHLLSSLAGGLAGAFASTLVYPLEMARTRMAVGAAHGNFVSAIVETQRAEGVAALFKGLDASLVGVVPYAAIRLASYDSLKAVWRRSTGRKDIDAQAALAFGALAGIASATATYPLEVTRRRMMAGAAYPNVAAALATIVRCEGWPALFNGVWLSLAKQGPAMAITFATYEMAKQFLEL